VKKRGRKPAGRVDCTWSSELAYAVGLITADGSLSNNGRHINFTSKDIDLIKNYQSCLGLDDITVGKKARARESVKNYYQIQFGDVIFYRWLESIGLHANKSKTISKVQVPDEYFFDFLRGEWDGDGTIYRSQDKRWRNSYIVSIGFASGSVEFLFWLQKEINYRLGTTGHISNSVRAKQLRYARADSRRIFAAMFYADNLPHLPRKFAKAKEIYRIDQLNL
jgi:hypothetical protein